jgi:F-type H+-transporting ATPase subunit alpha
MKHQVQDLGVIVSVRDGIYKVSGAASVSFGEMLINDSGSIGMAVSLESKYVSVIMFSESKSIPGNLLFRLFAPLSLNVDYCKLGGVFSPIGDFVGSVPQIAFFNVVQLLKEFGLLLASIEVKAPGIIIRESVKESLSTGIIGVDAAIPIGRGQRELIIGDRQTGKTSLAVDFLLNQAQVPVLYFRYLF